MAEAAEGTWVRLERQLPDQEFQPQTHRLASKAE